MVGGVFKDVDVGAGVGMAVAETVRRSKAVTANTPYVLPAGKGAVQADLRRLGNIKAVSERLSIRASNLEVGIGCVGPGPKETSSPDQNPSALQLRRYRLKVPQWTHQMSDTKGPTTFRGYERMKRWPTTRTWSHHSHHCSSSYCGNCVE